MPLPENDNKTADRSTRHHLVDPRFAALLEEDFDIETVVILDALEGEPQKSAISICAWAERTDDPAFALVAWARKHNRGRCGHRRTTTDWPDRTGRRHGSPGGDRPGTARPSDTPRRRGGSCGLDPVFVRANVAKMEG